jgi:hypothetical protein
MIKTCCSTFGEKHWRKFLLIGAASGNKRCAQYGRKAEPRSQNCGPALPTSAAILSNKFLKRFASQLMVRRPSRRAGTAWPVVFGDALHWRQVHYVGDVVAFEGATFQARCDTARPPGDDDWTCLATAGADGKDGSDGGSFRICGTYKASRISRARCGGAQWIELRCQKRLPRPLPGRRRIDRQRRSPRKTGTKKASAATKASMARCQLSLHGKLTGRASPRPNHVGRQ